MKTLFKLEPLSFSMLKELPNAWSNENYYDLLELMEYGNTATIAKEDLKEMCMLSITDYTPEDAAKIMLEYVFKDKLNSGQIKNLSHEIQEEKMWEEYADLSMHEDFYNVGQLLYDAYNGQFPHPQAIRFKIRLVTNNKTSLACFGTPKMENLLIQLLVQGMPQNTRIKRLFQDELETGNLDQAKDIIWQIKMINNTDNSIEFEVISSSYWFQDFKYVEPFEAVLHMEP